MGYNGQNEAGTLSTPPQLRSLHIRPIAPCTYSNNENGLKNWPHGEPTIMGSYLRTQFGVREADPRMGPPQTQRYKKHFEIHKGRKTSSKLGPLGGPTRNTFCINGPNSGSARWTPKWGRPGHGLSKNLAWVTPKGENEPKTGATLWSQFGVHEAGKPHKGQVSQTSMQNSIMGAS